MTGCKEQQSFRPIARQALLSLLAGYARTRLPDTRLPGAAAKILLIRPDHLGDILFTTPALRTLRESFPSAHISYLAGPWATPIIARSQDVDEVLNFEFPWFSGRPQRSFLHSYLLLFSLAKRLRRAEFAAAVNLRFDFWWGAALTALARIPYRLGYNTYHCRPFLDPAVSYVPGRHEVVQNVALVRHLAGQCNSSLRPGDDSSSLVYPISEDEEMFATRYLDSHDSRDAPVAILHPGTRAPIKMWTVSGFASLAAALVHRGFRVVLTGSPSETSLTADIKVKCGLHLEDAAGQTTLGQLAALFRHASLVVGVDSGPMHVAAALDRPTVHLYGPSDHVCFGPYGNPSRHVVVRSGLTCSPCHRLSWPTSELETHDCMSTITLEQVLRAVERVMSYVPTGAERSRTEQF